MSSEKSTRQGAPQPLISLPPVPTMREDMVDSEDELSAWRDLQSGATTPNVQEAVENLKRSLSFSTLHEMSTNPSSELRRNLQNKLWRPKDEEARLPSDWERLIVHVVRAGARAFMLAYGLRSSISALVALIKSLRSRRKFDTFALKEAFIGEDTIRFALMFGLWSSSYKFVSNALRLMTPMHKGSSPNALCRSKTAPVTGSSQDGLMMGEKHHHKHHHKHDHKHDHKHEKHQKHAKAQDSWKHLSSYDPRVRYWHPYVAGAISSLAMLVERKSLVQSFGPQLFLRGLEGSYRFARSLGYIDIPYGSVLAFGIANAEIISAWLSRPDHLSRAYKRWIDKASEIPLTTLDVYHESVNGTGPSPWDLEKLFGGQLPEPISTSPLKYPDMPPTKDAPMGISGDVVAKMYRWFDSGDLRRFPTCALSHPWTTNHAKASVFNFWSRWKWILPVYLTLYFVPTVFLRPKTLLRSPKTALTRVLTGSARSSAFLAAYIVIVKSFFCFFEGGSDMIRYSPRLSKLPGAMTLSKIMKNDNMKVVAGFSSCLSLFCEHKHRRSELTAYVMPKAMEAYWAAGRERGLLPHVPYGDFLLAMVSVSMIMGAYTHNPTSLSRLVHLVIYQFMGRN